jgi:hypothetical protein
MEWAMAGRRRIDVAEKDLSGFKYFEKLKPLFKRLHGAGCVRDKAGNRELHFDEYCTLILLFLFNPIVTSLRGLQQASELKSVQKKLGVPRASLGSLSEARQVFDPELLQPIIAELAAQARPLTRDPRLRDVKQLLTLVDGTLLSALPRMAEASFLKRQTGSGQVKWCLHTHFDVEKSLPARMDLTPDSGGEHDERAVLERVLESDRLYVMDRGYAKFKLFNAIVAKGSSYVCRLRDNSVYEVVTEQPLTRAGRQADIVSDQIVLLGQSRKPDERPSHPLRLVIVKVEPHISRGKYRGGSTGVDTDGFLRIATNRLDVPAEIIALLYEHRWAIELFFRMFKHLLGCRHLLSHHPDGIKIQTYCAIIACLLISLWTGRQPTKRTHEMLCYFLMGWATEGELEAHLAKLKPRDEQTSAKKS